MTLKREAAAIKSLYLAFNYVTANTTAIPIAFGFVYDVRLPV
jgi:hypothetical protein